MSDESSSIWRDEERIPLRDLERAVGVPSNDGQLDDVTGNDAGYESAFGHGAEAADGNAGPEGGGREMTDDQRAYRPSTTGRNGPH
ncbi:hypothetical protein AB0J86_15595 [Micromonospora sp. NPDC049559]|uniref:hypothetical protein n=1 Tax=Micromonospora sp. NPDC049559 TaxID=3155923 RepID=UPI00342E42CB